MFNKNILNDLTEHIFIYFYSLFAEPDLYDSEVKYLCRISFKSEF